MTPSRINSGASYSIRAHAQTPPRILGSSTALCSLLTQEAERASPSFCLGSDECPSPERIVNPCARMLRAALVSRSCLTPQTHSQLLSFNASDWFMCPQQLQVLDDGKKRSTFANALPAQSLLYSSMVRNSDQFTSLILRASLRFFIMLVTLKLSTAMTWFSSTMRRGSRQSLLSLICLHRLILALMRDSILLRIAVLIVCL